MTTLQFSKIVKQYQALVYTVCNQLVQDHALAEDLTQETFLSAYTHMDSCPPEQYKPWLIRIASNKATDHLRSAWHRKVTAPGEETLALLPRDGPLTVPGPEELALSRSEADAIRQLVLDLNEPYLTVSRLFFLEEKTVDEIALLLHRPKKTVRTQLYRAKLLLQQQIKERSGTG